MAPRGQDVPRKPVEHRGSGGAGRALRVQGSRAARLEKELGSDRRLPSVQHRREAATGTISGPLPIKPEPLRPSGSGCPLPRPPGVSSFSAPSPSLHQSWIQPPPSAPTCPPDRPGCDTGGGGASSPLSVLPRPVFCSLSQRWEDTGNAASSLLDGLRAAPFPSVFEN